MKVLIYTIGDVVNGFGHVMRSLTLAVQLHQRGVEVVFVTPDNTPGLDRLRRSPFAVLGHVNDDWLSMPAEVVIIDVEHGPRRPFLKAARERYQNVVTVCGSGYKVDDPAAVGELSDLVIEQNPFAHARTLPADTLTGPEYIMIDPRYADLTPNQNGPIVLSMGGGDPYGVTQPIANALGAAGYPHVKIIVGPAAAMPDIRNGKPHIIRAPDSLLTYLDGASLFIGALGMTSFEAAAAGVPALLVSWTGDHEQVVQLFDESGAAINCGLAVNLNSAGVTELIGNIATLLAYEQVWSRMSAAARRLCDGQGAGRVADKLIEMMGEA